MVGDLIKTDGISQKLGFLLFPYSLFTWVIKVKKMDPLDSLIIDSFFLLP